MTDWGNLETNTHQDHVIAHVIGTTILGHFVWDETAYLLLDIGFVWNMYLDGEMGLLPHPVMISELEAENDIKSGIRSDVDELLRDESGGLRFMTKSLVSSPIVSVELSGNDDLRRLVVTCEDAKLVVETSLSVRDVKIYAL